MSPAGMPPQAAEDWRRSAARRLLVSRVLSFSLVGVTAAATFVFLTIYNYPPWVTVPLTLANFGLGYLGISYLVSLWFGFFASLRGRARDRHHPLHRACDIGDGVRIAVLMPVYHEDPRRVCAALGAMWSQLARFPEARHFDFFVLSDSRRVDIVVQEEWTVHVLKEQFPDARIVYRHRPANTNAKLGNISDFLRRWGAHYKYLLMLDADSIVPPESMIAMARIMEGSPRIGLVQANLSMVFRNTLYAKINKFIASINQTIAAYGNYFFYLGQGNYFGHNAIIRTDAFMAHCALPILKKRGPWMAGRPLSHDFVEAALLEGAGYEVWTLPDIESYEELPTNLIDDMRREMRWMYGSMTYLRVFLISRISPLYKMRLLSGAVNYLNPLLGWVFFLMGLFGLSYVFHHPERAFFMLQRYQDILGASAFVFIAALLAKLILPFLYHIRKKTVHHYGNLAKMFWSYLLCFAYGLMIGPIYMAQFSYMLLLWLKGRKIQWGEQHRDDRAIGWSEAFRHFWWISALGLLLTWLVYRLVVSADTHLMQTALHMPRWGLLIWYVPLLSGLIGAVLLVRLTSREFPLLNRMGWFASPDETAPHPVLTETLSLLPLFEARVPERIDYADALLSPWFHARHRQLCVYRPHKFAYWYPRLSVRPAVSWTEREKRAVLSERQLFETFHRQAWTMHALQGRSESPLG